ncbi:MAG: C4-dicarboxylate ABC transporter [Chloroflexi bacterium]|nr:MAG: C4-dicarboxylate ABC transporter [Chloroflexota bacterium]
MSGEIAGLVMLVTLIFGIFVGFPIAFTLIILAVFFGFFWLGDVVFPLMYFQAIGLMKEEVLAAVPLFVFMGLLLQGAGLMERLFRSFQLILGGVAGSLYIGVLLTATLFAAATGIIGASVTVMGIMAGPTMRRSGYSASMSAGVITAGGTLGILIPPSVMLVVLAPILGISIVRLFAACIMPGLFLAGLYVSYAMVRSFLKPELGPVLPAEERNVSIGYMAQEFFLGLVPLAVLIGAALGSILFGLATPTEASAMGALGAILLTIAYRRLTVTVFVEAVRQTLTLSGLVLYLAVGALMFGAVFSSLGSASVITELLLSVPTGQFGVLIILMVVIFLLGWPMEWPAIIFIFIPIFMPLIIEMEYDLVWFGTLVAVNLQTAFLSPPVAVAAYYLKGVVPEWSLKDIYWGMLQFMGLQVIGLMVLLFFPPLALWLPGVLFG